VLRCESVPRGFPVIVPRLLLAVLLGYLGACSGEDQVTRTPGLLPPPDAGVADVATTPPDAAPPWSDATKCENLCQRYCVHKHMCDGSSIDTCRMAIDEADGGTCAERADLFRDIPQAQVEACIDAIEAMSCPAFLRMFNTGEGVPPVCHGILI
jgi:hypothetical protein